VIAVNASGNAVKRIKRGLKRRLKHLRWRYIQRFHRFDKEQLKRSLRELGIRKGDVVLAHIAYDRFEGYRGGPLSVIGVLQEILGSEGTLLMPTMPFGGSAVDYVRTQPPLDVLRTPSVMGLVSELFRRRPGVVRSVHATHPVAAWGKHANSMVSEHQLAETPCGKHSPFLKLLDFHGKILFLGVDIRSMTFFHGVEELLEPLMPFSPFTAEWFELRVRDSTGTDRTIKSRLYNSSLQRDPLMLIPALKRRGHWRENKIGTLRATLLEAERVLEVSRDLAEQNTFCYRLT
jgi:aminoglycoside 3-N-acetyltransferase